MLNIIVNYVVRKEEDANGDPVTINYIEIAGNSADTKPTGLGIAGGSIFTETDTGTVFFYDDESEAWIEQFSFQG